METYTHDKKKRFESMINILRYLFLHVLVIVGCLVWPQSGLGVGVQFTETAFPPDLMGMSVDFYGPPEVNGVALPWNHHPRLPWDRYAEKTIGKSGENVNDEKDSFVFGKDIPLGKEGVPPAAVALNWAVGMNDVGTVKEMIARGIDVNSRMEDTRQTPLMAAESAEMAALLLNAGADPRITDSQGATSLHYAVLKEDALGIIPLLLSAGAVVDAVEPAGGETPFLWAKQWFFGIDREKGRKVLGLLHQKGADLNFKDKFGNSLLHIAVMNGNEPLVSLLLEIGADASLINADGMIPLEIARELKFSEISALLQKGLQHPSP
jgi:hypothetical protein